MQIKNDNDMLEELNKNKLPTAILYSFRRCPFAIRARLALLSAKIPVIIREISLKNKPSELKSISNKATVPCLKTFSKTIPESLEIMSWALSQNDPEGLLNFPSSGLDLIEFNDGPFKTSLDRTKYNSRYDYVDLNVEYKLANEFLTQLDVRLKNPFIMGERKSLVDLALFPFIRQYAFIDKARFDNKNWRNLSKWLNSFLNSEAFLSAQRKYPIWQPGDEPRIF